MTLGESPLNCPEPPKYHYREMAWLPLQKAVYEKEWEKEKRCNKGKRKKIEKEKRKEKEKGLKARNDLQVLQLTRDIITLFHFCKLDKVFLLTQ